MPAIDLVRRFPGLAIFGLLLVAGNAVARSPRSTPLPSDRELTRQLQGYWCDSNVDGKTCTSYDRFLPDGTALSCGQIPGRTPPYRVTHRYTVKDGRVCYRVMQSPVESDIDRRYCSTVVSIDAAARVYRPDGDRPDGAGPETPRTDTRVRGGRPPICPDGLPL